MLRHRTPTETHIAQEFLEPIYMTLLIIDGTRNFVTYCFYF